MKKYLIPIICGLAVSGIVYAATIAYPQNGGTGTNTIPSYGQVLVGTSAGIYTPTDISSLNISSVFPFTPTSDGNATSTRLIFGNGFISQASSTISSLSLPLALGGLAINSNGQVYSSATTTFSSPLVYTSGVVNCPTCVLTSRNINTTYPLLGGGALSGDLTLSSGFGTTTTIGLGVSQLLAVDNSGIMIASSTIGNGQLQNNSITVTTASPLGGSGTIPLGGTLALTCTGCLTSAITSLNGLSGATQTFSVSNASNLSTLSINSATTIHTFSLVASSSPTFGSIYASSTIASILPYLTNSYASSTSLSVSGSSYFATSNGNVGIGTTTPTNKLEVNGSIYTSSGVKMPDGNTLKTGLLKTGITIPNATSTDATVAINTIQSNFPNASTIRKVTFLVDCPQGCVGSSPGALLNIYHGTDRSASTTASTLFSTSQYAYSTTTAQTLTSFNDSTLAANESIWYVLTSASSTPINVAIDLWYTED